MSFFVAPGVNLNLIPYFDDQSIASGTAALMIAVWAFIGAIGAFAAGFATERVPVRYVASVTYFGLAVGVCCSPASRARQRASPGRRSTASSSAR